MTIKEGSKTYKLNHHLHSLRRQALPSLLNSSGTAGYKNNLSNNGYSQSYDQLSQYTNKKLKNNNGQLYQKSTILSWLSNSSNS